MFIYKKIIHEKIKKFNTAKYNHKTQIIIYYLLSN